MDLGGELEDDLFFADLSKQIALLIMDDDDDDQDPLANCSSLSLQAFSHAIHPPVQAQFVYEQSCRRESKGTGVFIPQSIQPRRNRQRQSSRFISNNTNNNNSPFYAKSQRLQQQQQQQIVHDHNTKMVVSQQVQVVASNNVSLKSKFARV